MTYKFPVIKRLLKTAKELKTDPDIKAIKRNVVTEALGSLASSTIKYEARSLLDKIGKKRKK